MKVLIGADIVPTKANYSEFSKGDLKALVGDELTDLLKSADYRVFNLETPLTAENHPIDKCGLAMYTPKESITGYEKLGIDLLTLANNHILDQGREGLKETTELLKSRGISFFGVGENIEHAQEPLYVTVDGVKIGFFTCVENEFSCATDDMSGANPYDPLVSFDIVADMKGKCDRIIVLFHGGKEHYRYPSPDLQRLCRKFVDVGADLLICQHSHCIGCMEEYHGGKIIYGQGNFVFIRKNDECWKSSLLLQVGDGFALEFIPIVQTSQGTRLANTEEAATILNDFYQRSEEIKSRAFVESKYREKAERDACYYQKTLFGINRGFFRKTLNKITRGRYSEHLVKKLPKDILLMQRNYIKAESHRELVLSGLDELISKK